MARHKSTLWPGSRSCLVNCGVKLRSEPLRWRAIGAGRRRLRPVESFLVGTWLSLVEHSLGVRGVGSSNLPVPTNTFRCLYFLAQTISR